MTEAEITQALEDQKRSAMLLVRRDRELSKAYDQLREIDRIKSEFISIAAHQMRTPLSAIKWSHQMLLKEELGPITDEQRQMLDQSLQSVHRMVRLVNNLLDADHLDIGKRDIATTEVDLTMIITEVIASFAQAADEKHITITTNLDANARCEANAERMKDVFSNLIDNAIKYTKAEGEITLSLKKREGGGVVATITDTGIGIPDEHKPKLFTRFARAENAKRVDADGSGLGLYIVGKIIENHDGTITCDSTEGQGTTFTISLPDDVK